MYLQTSIALNKREKLVSDFSIELGCERSEAWKYLSCGNFDYSSSMGLFILTRLLSKSKKQSRLKKVHLPEKMRINEIVSYDQRKQEPQSPTTDLNSDPNIEASANEILLENRDHLTFEKLCKFLMTNPSPSWNQRLMAFKLYDSTLMSGFPDALETKKKIVIDKRLFVIYGQINQGVVSSKNLQRGVITYLERIGFLKINDRSRKRMVFHWGKN
ncbi:hypothetical protein M0813_18983 [Anaeramoeba flamelloides]|uniref:Uncharacterized protein n=1 Tax=Anaeramoeba flamelloides TaxID=1746091 RepID=A0ABQ8YSA2_9EUKA|nr:hypothetical protein M0813_18983 [Anaeramoeba flamelloides]